MLKYIPLLLLACLSFSFTTDGSYNKYCNARFSFCIEYPNSFKKHIESTNGDGVIFKSADKKAEIRAYGKLAMVEDEDLDKLSKQLELVSSDIKVTYKIVKENWFIISGTDKNGDILYHKTVKKAIKHDGDSSPTVVFQSLRIVYPSSQKDVYSDYCSVIAKSFSHQ